MEYDDFVKAVKAVGVKELLRDVSEYKDLEQAELLYAVNDIGLVGVYAPKNKGMIFGKPKKLWSKSRRKFEKVKI